VPQENPEIASAEKFKEDVQTGIPRAIAYGIVNAPFQQAHEAAHARTPDEVIHALTGVGLSMDPRSPAARPSDARGGRAGQAAALGLSALALPEEGAGAARPAANTVMDALGDAAVDGSKTLPRFAILSADREGLSPQVLRERHNALGHAIRDMGYEPVEHNGGVWRNPKGELVRENGYIVPSMPAAQARHAAARFGQDAVITNEGYHDLNAGTTAPLTDAGAPFGDEPHTVLPGGKKLAMRFDFDSPQQTGIPEVGAPQGGVPPTASAKGNADLQNVGAAYRASAGLTHAPLPPAERVNPAAARSMSAAYEALQSSPNAPETKAAYARFVSETRAQADALKNAGYSWSFVDKDPYPNSAAMLKDLRDNKHINVFRTSGEGHPLMTNTENDEFRAVHDILGHGTGGHSFGPLGEENAYRQHSALYSPEAQRALATETRGQNSWFNFGPHAHLPVRERPFAEQKAALFPEHLTGEYRPTLPEGAPSILGASEPKFAYRDPGTGQRHGLPLAQEDVDGLGVAGRHLLQDAPGKEEWLERMKQEHPAYAPHLSGWAGDRAYAVANRAKLPELPSEARIHTLAHTPEGAATRPWYHTWTPEVRAALGNEEDAEMLTRFHAILSAQKSPHDNAAMSLSALRAYKAGDRSFSGVGATPERIEALQRQFDAGPRGLARMAEHGPKVNNFYLALKGSPEAVVIDRHIARAYLGKPDVSHAEYAALESRIRHDAARAGQSPRDFQAMVWGGQTKYPFETPESHLWAHLAEGHEPELLNHYSGLTTRALEHEQRTTALASEQAPTHAAVRFTRGPHAGAVHEVPMARGHAGALEQAIEQRRSGEYSADDVMNDLEDGYTRGDGKFIPRADVNNLHTSDFIHARRRKPKPE